MADFFESILYQEMHLLIQDGSTEEVSDLLLDFYDKCSNMSEEAVIAAVRTLPKCDLSKCQVKQDEDESPVAVAPDPSAQLSEQLLALSATEKEEKEVAPPSGPDPDGWETVVTRKKKR